MIGEDFILEFFNQFGPFALALLSFTEAIIQPIPPDVMFLPMVYDERNSVNISLVMVHRHLRIRSRRHGWTYTRETVWYEITRSFW